MIHKIIVSDRDFNVLEDLTAEASNISWGYNRNGGCGSFSFSLPTRFCEETSLGGNFNIKIYAKNLSTKIYDLWYQGRIENKANSVVGNKETLSIKGSGYQSEIKDIYVDTDYSNKTIEYIVDDLLDTYVVGNTNITKGTIAATGFTADTLEFSTDVLSALQTCADIVGSREWGVDKNREFFFKARSSTVGIRYPLDGKVLKYNVDNSSKDIVNRVVITGGDVAGSSFTRTINNTQSQLKWSRRDRSIQNSAIVTNDVADQFADAIFAEFDDVVRRGKVDLIDNTLIEATIPIPLLEVIAKVDTYGTKLYGTSLYSAVVPFQIQRINYKLGDDGTLTIGMQIGQLRPSIAESLNQLSYQIDQVRQQGV